MKQIGIYSVTEIVFTSVNMVNTGCCGSENHSSGSKSHKDDVWILKMGMMMLIELMKRLRVIMKILKAIEIFLV